MKYEIPGVPKKMIHKILFFYENPPSQNWTKLYWLDAHMIEVLIGGSYNPFRLPKKEIEPTGQ